MRFNRFNEELLGHWVLKREDLKALNDYGMVMLKFGRDGILAYTIFEHEKEKVILLIYEVHGDEIITYQPSTGNQKEITKYQINEGKLTLNFQGNLSMYERLPESMI